MHNYEQRVADNERDAKQAEESRRRSAEIQRQSLTVGVVLAAVGFVLGGITTASGMFICGYVAAAWVAVEGTRERPPK